MVNSTFTQVATFTSLITSSPNLTRYISVSQDDSLAVVETDSEHPITVIDLTTHTAVGQYSFTGAIHRASFLNNNLILITTSSSLYLLNR